MSYFALYIHRLPIVRGRPATACPVIYEAFTSVVLCRKTGSALQPIGVCLTASRDARCEYIRRRRIDILYIQRFI